MRYLRLLVTKNCDRNCKGCCNKDWDLDNLPIVKDYNYDLIMITGGEPMLYFIKLIKLIKNIQENNNAKIILYTANLNVINISYILYRYLAGITLTLHRQKDIERFKLLNNVLLLDSEYKNKSLRLNIFEGIELSKNIDLSLWEVKNNIKWIKNCPLPKNEEFKRLKNLFIKE